MGGFEIIIILLGLGLRWRINYKETEAMRDIKKTRDDIESGKIKAKSLKDFLNE